ncbi:MAG: hypothetical protein HC880_16110 [Bacteroidia bacterium]|nr:hypothetical protein [Bacteroidia bacterium]
MKHILLFLFLTPIGFGYADQLSALSEDQAQQAIDFMKDHPHLVLWCACCGQDTQQYLKISRVYYQRHRIVEEMYEVVVSGVLATGDSISTAVDLAYIHVVKEGIAYCVGDELGFECDPCTAPFEFSIPLIEAPKGPEKLSKMKLKRRGINPPQALNYVWPNMDKQPDMIIPVFERWASALAFTPDEAFLVVGGGFLRKLPAWFWWI